MKITKVEYTELPYVRVLPKTYATIRSKFFEDHGVFLPSYNEITKDKDFLYVFTKDCKIKVYSKKYGVMTFIIKAGFFTDLASVPKYLKSFLASNDSSIIVSAIIHDGLYGTHYLSFSGSNSLFKQIIRIEGGSWWMQYKAYTAVSLFGYSRYEDQLPSVITEERKLFKLYHYDK